VNNRDLITELSQISGIH